MPVDITSQDRVSQLVARSLHLPPPVEEGMLPLGGLDGVEHHGQIAAGGVFHAHGHVDARGRQPVLLIFHTPGAHRHIGQKVAQIPVIRRIQHLVGGGKPRFRQHPGVEPPDGDDALEEVVFPLRVGLVQEALVALAGGAGLVGVDPGNQDQLFPHLLLQARQPGAVFQHRILPVGGAGADDEGHPAAPPRKNVRQLPVPPPLDLRQGGGQGVARLDLLRHGEPAFEVHIFHGCTPWSCFLHCTIFRGEMQSANTARPYLAVTSKHFSSPNVGNSYGCSAGHASDVRKT